MLPPFSSSLPEGIKYLPVRFFITGFFYSEKNAILCRKFNFVKKFSTVSTKTLFKRLFFAFFIVENSVESV